MSRSAFHTFTDLDAFHAAFRDMRAESVITGRGDFRAEFATIQLDRLSLHEAEETLPRTAYSAADPRQFVVTSISHPRPQSSSHSPTLHPHSLSLLPQLRPQHRHSAPMPSN